MTLERTTKARLVTALVLLLVLGAGVVLGVALDRRLEARTFSEEGVDRGGPESGTEDRSRGFDRRRRPPSRDPSLTGDSTRRRPDLIVDQVGLTERQVEQADSIFWHYRRQMRALHEEFDQVYSARYREIVAESRESMLSILTPEQRVVYDSLLVEWDRRIEERRRDSTSSRNDSGNRR